MDGQGSRYLSRAPVQYRGEGIELFHRFQRPIGFLAQRAVRGHACATYRAPARSLRNRACDPFAGRDDGFDAAVTLYDRGAWPEAFAALVRLANQGHAQAAKLALLMLRYGASLYGTAFRAEAPQIAPWAARVIDAGKATSPRRGLRQ